MWLSHTGEAAALATACCWTITALAFEHASKSIGSLAVNLLRLPMAFCFLAAFGWVSRGAPLPTDASTHAWIWLSLSGLVGFALGDLCLFRGFVLVGARVSMLLMALVPLFTALAGWLVMGERLDARDWLGMVLTIGGVAWVVTERKKDGANKQSSLRGVLLGLGGAVGQAVGLVLSKYGMQGYDAFAATQIRVIAGAVGFSIIFFAIGWWPRVIGALGDGRAMAGTALGALFGPFLGVSLSLVAVKHTEAGVAATIMALVPVMIIAPSALIFKERVTPRALAGAVIAVSGSALLFL